ncbi:MAG TPA: hypothetical protein VM912_18085 [Terriglobales bacterium]|nr:hypothetical protein [Terriglobales bacterium]
MALLAASLTICSGAFASDNAGQPNSDWANVSAAPMVQKSEGPTFSHRPGISFKTSLLGLGGDMAVPVTRRSNVRFGFSAFNYSRSFDKDGVTYSGKLGLSSVQALYDIFPFGGGFHLSPGAMLYNGNQLTGKASVPGGQSFTLGGTNYTSDPSSPLSGNGKLAFSKAGPMFLLGWGNLAHRGERHFATSFDVGAVYQGVPRTTLSFAGRACDSFGLNCTDVASNPTFQSNVLAEQAKINHSASPARFYPVISMGFGYKF